VRIGRAIALALAQRGWDIAVHYRNSAAAAFELVDEIQAHGQRAMAFQVDLADEAGVNELLPRIANLLGPVQCIVNNASLFEEDCASHFSYAMLHRLSAVNLAAPVALSRALYRSLPEQADTDDALRGVVINVLDQKLFNQNPDFFSYTLTKAALHTATTTLAQALAPRVRVAAVAPGLILPWPEATPATFAQAQRSIPLQPKPEPQDIAEAVCYLVHARAVTGATLLVDGGQHLTGLPRDVMFL
jgi:NAD(P)-dependent dehydrogenase (short-subunit alcohol dehydrogenase family)